MFLSPSGMQANMTLAPRILSLWVRLILVHIHKDIEVDILSGQSSLKVIHKNLQAGILDSILTWLELKVVVVKAVLKQCLAPDRDSALMKKW